MHHTLIGFCIWDIPALIILIAVIVVFIIRHRKLNKKIDELEDELQSYYEDAVDVEKGI